MAAGDLVLTVGTLELARLGTLGGGGIDGVLFIGRETRDMEGLLTGA